MPRSRSRSRSRLDKPATLPSTTVNDGNHAVDTNEGENDMSTTDEQLQFTEPLTSDEWVSEGGSGSAKRGVYAQVLIHVRDSEQRYHRIPMDRGPFAGKVSQSVATALKNARDGKNAPEGVSNLLITSKSANEEKKTKGVVFIENPGVADTEDES